MKIETYTGGIFDTNAYLVTLPGGRMLIDAPQGVADWVDLLEAKIDLLLLTHAHIDHVMDAAELKRRHQCPIYGHADSSPILEDPGMLKRLGFQLEFEPVKLDRELAEGPDQEICGHRFALFDVPGHCPGSLCFLSETEHILFGGDVLFAGGIGRWDLPGGDRELLLDGIRKKLFVLDDAVKVLSGHGPATTIGAEKRNNPFFH